ncbi:MAG: phage/plasmid replication protein, II/X family [Azovibrio restrictus]|nr:phage/plasmid replication protein, II/X family [Azovibrio restrictus]MDD3483156.1 phage/plasmid replication protein, II/X family [Azovibrio restrictus]
MAVDTVKLRSPEIDEGTAAFLERQCILKQGVELATGEVLYEITTGSLDGSYDSRIMFKVCREDWITLGGKLQQVPCSPFVIVECSWHKFFHGQNVYGNPTDFQNLARTFVNLLGEIFLDGSDFPDRSRFHELFQAADKWQVRRVDWAEVFHLSPAAQREFFRSFRDVHFPRRAKKEAKYDSALHYPGTFTTFRVYSKGPEFKLHGAAQLRKALVRRQQIQDGQTPGNNEGEISKKVVAGLNRYKYINRKIDALQRLANWRLRFEVQVNADKLHYDFKGRYPLVSEINDEYLIGIYKEQIFKLFKEGKSEMETVRTYDQVKARLNNVHGKRSANNLLSFWIQLSNRGEEAVREEYSRSQFYDNRKKLVDAGISWHSTDVFIIPQDTALPRDFFPIQADPRRCIAKVSANSIFNFCPVEQHQLLKAA